MGTIAQYLVYPVVKFCTILFSNEVVFVGEENFELIVGKPAIIVANHISSYDSFLLRMSKYWIKMHVYFMGVTRFKSLRLQLLNKLGIIWIVYKLFGVFTVTPGMGLEKNLQVPRKLLSENKVVFIFPEGSINPSNFLLPFKSGAAALSMAAHVPILPIGFSRFFGDGRTKTIISVGKPFSFEPGIGLATATHLIEESVKNLCFTNKKDENSAFVN